MKILISEDSDRKFKAILNVILNVYDYSSFNFQMDLINFLKSK